MYISLRGIVDNFGEQIAPKFLSAYNVAVWQFCFIHNGDLELMLVLLNEHPALPADLLGPGSHFCIFVFGMIVARTLGCLLLCWEASCRMPG